MVNEVLTEEPPRFTSARFRWLRGWLRRRTWRSPPDQPAWARPLLLGIAVLAGPAYGWGMAGDSVEPYYGAAARISTMTQWLPRDGTAERIAIGVLEAHEPRSGALFGLPVNPPSEDPRVRWIENRRTTQTEPAPNRAIQFAYYRCDPSDASQ